MPKIKKLRHIVHLTLETGGKLPGKKYGGVGTALTNLLKGVKKRPGVRMHVITPGESTKTTHNGNITYYVLGGYPGSTYSGKNKGKFKREALKKLEEIRKRYKIDAVTIVGSMFNKQLIDNLRKKGLPYLLNAHGNVYWFRTELGPLHNRIMKKDPELGWEFHTINHSNYILVPRESLKKAMIKSVEKQAAEFMPNANKKKLVEEVSKKIHVVPNCIDANLYNPTKVSKKEKERVEKFLTRKGVDLKKHKIVLYFARIAPAKRMEYLISAMHKIKDPNVKLVIRGQVTDKDYYKRIKEMVKKLGIEDKVIFAAGGVYNPEKKKALFAVVRDTNGVGVVPDTGLGYAQLEMLSMKLPMVLSHTSKKYMPVKGQAFFTGEGELANIRKAKGEQLSKLLKESKGGKNLAMQINRVLKNREREKVAKDVREYIKEHLHLGVMANGYMKAIEEVMKKAA
jgi:glycosyltransferase involved in cell wall biosynthesis